MRNPVHSYRKSIWPARSKRPNSNVRIGFGFERHHSHFPLLDPTRTPYTVSTTKAAPPALAIHPRCCPDDIGRDQLPLCFLKYTGLGIPKEEATLLNLIVSNGRAGTTFLGAHLNLHPQVACINEGHYLPFLFDKIEQKAAPIQYFELLKTVNHFDGTNMLESNLRFLDVPQSAWNQWKHNLIKTHETLTIYEFQSALNQLIRKQTNAEIVIDKTPCYGIQLETLAKSFDELRVINVCRDVVPSVSSMLRHEGFRIKMRKGVSTWTEVLSTQTITEDESSPIIQPGEEVAMAELWARRTLAPLNHSTQSGNALLNLRYEDLVDDPRTFFEAVENFFGLAHSEQWVEMGISSISTGRNMKTRIKRIFTRILPYRNNTRGISEEVKRNILSLPKVKDARALLGYI